MDVGSIRCPSRWKDRVITVIMNKFRVGIVIGQHVIDGNGSPWAELNSFIFIGVSLTSCTFPNNPHNVICTCSKYIKDYLTKQYSLLKMAYL